MNTPFTKCTNVTYFWMFEITQTVILVGGVRLSICQNGCYQNTIRHQYLRQRIRQRLNVIGCLTCLTSEMIISHITNDLESNELPYQWWLMIYTVNDVIRTKAGRRDVRVGLSLQWRHNERGSVSNHQRLHCLHNCWFRRSSKKTSRLRVTGLCAGNSPMTGEFPAQKASNAKNVSIWWRHHGWHS